MSRQEMKPLASAHEARLMDGGPDRREHRRVRGRAIVPGALGRAVALDERGVPGL